MADAVAPGPTPAVGTPGSPRVGILRRGRPEALPWTSSRSRPGQRITRLTAMTGVIAPCYRLIGGFA
jgi:hypothetical protein